TALSVGTTDQYNLTINQTNATGNASITNSGSTGSLPVSFRHITGAGSSVLTFNGAPTTIFGNVTANNVVVNNVLSIDPTPRGTGTSTITSNAQINNKLVVASGVTNVS